MRYVHCHAASPNLAVHFVHERLEIRVDSHRQTIVPHDTWRFILDKPAVLLARLDTAATCARTATDAGNVATVALVGIVEAFAVLSVTSGIIELTLGELTLSIAWFTTFDFVTARTNTCLPATNALESASVFQSSQN